MKTITGTFVFPDGTPAAGCTLSLKLSQDAVVTGVGQVAPRLVNITLNSSGQVPATAPQIYGNDELTPSGTTYKVTVQDTGGGSLYGPENYNIAGASPVNLNTITPVSTSTILNPAPVLLNPAAQQKITAFPLELAKSLVLDAPSGNTVTVQAADAGITGNPAMAVQNFENIIFADQCAGADGGAKINAADTILGSKPGEIWVNQNVGTSWTTAVVISANHVLRFIQGGTYTSSASPMITLQGAGGGGSEGNGGALIGQGNGNMVVLQTSSGTADIIQITGDGNYISGVTLQSSVTRNSSGAGIDLVAGSGGGVTVENCFINPVYNGIFVGNGAGVTCNNVHFVTGTATSGGWNSFITIGGGSTHGTAADCFFTNCTGASDSTFGVTTACVVLDTGVDTARFVDCDFETSNGSGVVLKSQSTGGGGLDVPRWVRFIGCTFEADTAHDCILLNAYKDIRFIGCEISNGLIGLHVNNTSTGSVCEWSSGMIQQVQQNCVYIQAGSYTKISNSMLGGAGQQTNNTYDSVLVAANVSDFEITGNNFYDAFSYSNHPRWNINVLSGSGTNLSVIGNDCSNAGITGTINVSATGASRTVVANHSNIANLFNTSVSQFNRLKTNAGTAYSGADSAITLSGGWGASGAVSAARGYDQALTFVVTANGAGIGAGPTVTITFKDGTWTNAPIPVVQLVNDSAQVVVSSVSATQLVILFNATPSAGVGHQFTVLMMGV